MSQDEKGKTKRLRAPTFDEEKGDKMEEDQLGDAWRRLTNHFARRIVTLQQLSIRTRAGQV
ncbi:hypothetical protein N7455_011230 [Penicillium solitum]|uniref:uncharacterized protein n=1 Tax=Penicillium solitum TaxID=60172 RepID=UPI0032C40914|nr:hypothetical protein N7455_011230 [Penicillium solitum]